VWDCARDGVWDRDLSDVTCSSEVKKKKIDSRENNIKNLIVLKLSCK
jgi:hypothetical protein